MLNELALAMTANGDEKTLDAALRDVAAGRGGEAVLGAMLREALAGSAAPGAIAVLDLLVDKLGVDPAEAARARPGCGCKSKGGGDVTDGGIVLMSFTDSSSGGDSGDDGQDYIGENGNGQYDEGEPILVTGTKPKTVDEEPGYEGDPGSDVGGGDNGGGSGSSTNTPEFTSNVKETCAKGVAVKIGDHIENVLVPSIGEFEFGAIIVKGADGLYGPLGGGIHTDYSATYVNLTPGPGFTDYANVYGIVQNQPWNDQNLWGNYLNRYPSAQDWVALERLASLGANPANLSIFITDPWGVTREFKLADKSIYEAMNDSQRSAGQNLPANTKACG